MTLVSPRFGTGLDNPTRPPTSVSRPPWRRFVACSSQLARSLRDDRQILDASADYPRDALDGVEGSRYFVIGATAGR